MADIKKIKSLDTSGSDALEKASSKILINKIVKIIVNTVHPKQIILFGSYARHEQNEHSDIDIMVVKEDTKPRQARAAEIRKQLRGICFPIDLVVYTPKEIKEWESVPNSFVYSVMQEGLKVYG